MKPFLYSTFILIASGSFAQGEEPEHVRIGVDTTQEVRCFPHIGPFYEGEVPMAYLANPIEASEGMKVISFSISYADGNMNKTVPVQGDKIPAGIIRNIYANSAGEMIFITNIVALDREGRRTDLVPMSLVPVK